LNSKTDPVVGIIFPVKPEHAERFFNSPVGQKVFVKFFGKERTPRRLSSGARLFFYRSGGGKEIIGEAKITEIDSGTLDQVWKEYCNALFLTRAELESYVGDRKARQMLVLVTENAKKYSTPLKLQWAVTKAGQYMTKELYDRLRYR
jgi:hypothetical protein